jgi:hypothetical protein
VDRFKRLLTEAGVSWYVIGASTTRMGPQKADKLIDLIKEIAATEDGLVFDGRGILAICLRTRRSRTNQASALDLVLADHVVPPMKERLDNVGVTNQIILEDRSGAVAVAERTTGPMSTAAYPAGIGVYKGGAQPDVNVNLYDPGELQNAANWYLARGTVPGARWPSVTVEVGLKSPTIQTAACTVEIGDRITVTGRTPDVLELQVIGYTMTVGTHTLTITYVCIPGDMFLLGAEDSTTYVLDAYASTIITAPAPATTGTSMVVGSPDPDDVWSTTSLPYPIVVAGERMTVTAATAPALTAGTWRQTLTVTRSVNGVVKAQVVGAPVHVFYPIREAW